MCLNEKGSEVSMKVCWATEELDEEEMKAPQCQREDENAEVEEKCQTPDKRGGQQEEEGACQISFW